MRATTVIVVGAMVAGCTGGVAGERGPAGEQGPPGVTGDRGPAGERGPAGDRGPAGIGAAHWVGADGATVEGATTVEATSVGALGGVAIVYVDGEGVAWALDPITCEVEPVRGAVRVYASDDCTGPAHLLADGAAESIAVVAADGEIYALEGVGLFASRSRYVGGTCEATPPRDVLAAPAGMAIDAPAVACVPPLRLAL